MARSPDETDPTEKPERPRRDHRDKVPALMVAARKARDDETALLLLQKAKQIDPARMDLYLLRAEIYERRGDDQRELLELREGLEVDPVDWMVRFRILNLEYPKTRNLKHAAGIIRDLAWQRRLPERLFNAARGALRSESELGHDEALLGHLALAGRPGYGTVEIVALAATPRGDTFVLNAHEPWLERFSPEGKLVYGIDLWLTEDEDLAQQPADVAATASGVAFVVEPRAGRVLCFGPDGEYAGTLGGRTLPEPCAVDIAAEGEIVVVVCARDGTVRRFDPAAGKAVGRAALDASAAALRLGGLAVAPDGTAYVLAGNEILVVPPGARKESGRIELPKSARRPLAKCGKPPRRGMAYDASDGSLLLALPGRHAVLRIDREGREVERIGGGKAAGLRFPRDVAADGAGTVAIADFGNARVVRRRPGRGDLETLLGGEGWGPP